MGLSDMENCAIGLICGTADTTLLQSTNYWKNASQQGLPFTLNPAVLYRGYLANTLNNGFCVMSQFYINGLVKKALLGDATRELSDVEKIAAGVTSGALSGIVCGPMELIMIQQQRKGTGLLTTTANVIKAGPSTFFRGTGAMMAREGIYAGGFLGVMPVTRQWIRDNMPDSLGRSDDSARFAAAMIAGPMCGFASHPPDTIKTCMQGDIEHSVYKGYGQTLNKIVTTKGWGSLWAGFPWRMFRQCCAVMLFDKIATDVSILLFPHAFPHKKKEFKV
ncbi:hypothetical protein AB1Y20_022212 [Prymnesium parvum]|uniref:Mitochondrial carrier protein n=1 Tax=Prymnesium parvum TaxID=97485 RepID=A0AB34JGF3_PRYPA